MMDSDGQVDQSLANEKKDRVIIDLFDSHLMSSSKSNQSASFNHIDLTHLEFPSSSASVSASSSSLSSSSIDSNSLDIDTLDHFHQQLNHYHHQQHQQQSLQDFGDITEDQYYNSYHNEGDLKNPALIDDPFSIDSGQNYISHELDNLQAHQSFSSSSPSLSSSSSSLLSTLSAEPLSSPSWASLDQFFFTSLPQHPQSSPLLPFDLIPNSLDRTTTSDGIEKPCWFNHASLTSSIDGQLEDWNLTFYSLLAKQESGLELPQLNTSSSDCTGTHLSEHSLPTPIEEPGRSPLYHEEGISHPTVETDDAGVKLFISAPRASKVPAPLSSSNFGLSLPSKRRRSVSLSPLGQASAPLDSLNMSLIHPSIETSSKPINSDNSKGGNGKAKTKAAKRPKNNAKSATPNAYVCRECGKSFPRLTCLTQHNFTHSGERPFRCGFEGCNKSFTTSSNSKRHWRTHF